jgi:carbon-monoxide dehydrogenase large subunit
MAKGKIVELDVDDAAGSPGVVRVFTAETLNGKCEPWVGTLDHFANMQSTSQNMLADRDVLWVGHPVVMIIANSRAEAEDACELVMMEIEDEIAVVDGDAALAEGSPLAADEIPAICVFRRYWKLIMWMTPSQARHILSKAVLPLAVIRLSR